MRGFGRKLAWVTGTAICGVAYGVLMMAGSPIGCTSTSSSSPVCGDGFVADTEACDDSNTLAGDGCSSTCEIESGWTCTGIPSRCQRTCSGGMCSAPKIVREVDYWGSCGNLPAMAFSYNEGDCLRVQPKFGGVSASSKRVTCSLEADGYWYAHITKYSDGNCSVPTGTLDTKANNRCLSDPDPEDKGSVFQCVGAVPVLCNAA